MYTYGKDFDLWKMASVQVLLTLLGRNSSDKRNSFRRANLSVSDEETIPYNMTKLACEMRRRFGIT